MIWASLLRGIREQHRAKTIAFICFRHLRSNQLAIEKKLLLLIWLYLKPGIRPYGNGDSGPYFYEIFYLKYGNGISAFKNKTRIFILLRDATKKNVFYFFYSSLSVI